MYQVQKKRKSGWLFFSLFICAFLVGIGIGVAGKYLQKNPENEPQESRRAETIGQEDVRQKEVPNKPASATPTQEPEPIAKPETTYYVVAQDGKVCVFLIDDTGKWRFSHNLSIELDALREEDKKLFEEGLTVSSKEDLLSLVEDFSS